MLSKLLTPALCALAIFVIGTGIEPVTAGERSADATAYAEVLSGEASLRTLPTVTVVANADRDAQQAGWQQARRQVRQNALKYRRAVRRVRAAPR